MLEKLKFLKNIKKLRKVNITKSFIISRKLKKGLKIIIYKKSYFKLDPTALIKVDDKAKLEFGKTWEEESLSSCLGGGISIGKRAILYIKGYCNIYSGAKISLRKNSILTLGNCFINNKVSIICSKSITIGDNTAIGPNVVIRDSDDHILIPRTENSMSSPIIIGNNVWVGTNVIILKGVHIGDGAVIAAGSIVTKDIPSGCLAAGVPAKVIRRDIKWIH